jgi:hypothetical protein
MKMKNNNLMLPVTLASLSFAAAVAYGARPGDQAKLTAVNPAYSIENITPSGFYPIGGMDFRGNDLLMTSWKDPTGVYVLKNATTVAAGTATQEFALGLAESLGLKVVDGKIYVLQKEELTELIDSDGDGKADNYRAVAYDWTKSIMEKEYAVGLAWDGAYFYAAYGDPTMGSGTAVDPIPAGRHNGVLQIALDGTVKPYAGGMRVPQGIEMIYGKLWVQEIQGGYRPSNPLFQVNQGDWFGRPVNPPSTFQPIPMQEFADNGPNKVLYKRAAIDMQFAATGDQRWSPGGRCPAGLMEVKSGPYKGQILVPDAEQSTSGISRVFMEKVGGQYQGANFHFAGGAPFAADALYRMVNGPDGNIYVGGNGSNNAGWSRATPAGLNRMKLTGQTPMDILAVRSLGANSFEVEFTKPLAASLGADVKAHVEGRRWFNRYQFDYGIGFQQGNTVLSVSSAAVSSDRKKVVVSISNLEEGYVVYLHFKDDALAAEGGEKLWGTEAWYNLNKFGPGEDATPVLPDAKSALAGSHPFKVSEGFGMLRVEVSLPNGLDYDAELVDLSGRVHATHSGRGNGEFMLPTQGLSRGVYALKCKAGGLEFSQLISR